MTRPPTPLSGTPSARLPPGSRERLKAALEEDRYRADRTTRALIRTSHPGAARIVAQARGVLSGLDAAALVARLVGLRSRRRARDGEHITPGRTVLELSGDVRAILASERTMLNLLMHLSGVATLTARAVRAAHDGRTSLAILATRKTLPGLRDLEKAAVMHGGGYPHRRDLSEAVLLKRTHLVLEPLPEAVARVRRRIGPRPLLEVEVHTLREATAAVRAGADALLIDNRTPHEAQRIVSGLTQQGLRGRCWIELSGGITVENLPRYVPTGADAASLGSLTHSAPAVPFHLIMSPGRARSRPT